MKPYRFFLFLSAVLVFTAFSQPSFSQTFQPGRTPLEIQLSSLPQVTEVLRLESNTFNEKYRIRVRQMVNHEGILRSPGRLDDQFLHALQRRVAQKNRK